jgi:NADPH-dependent glutamate synthase beta subunit-like oxidoreductase
MDTYLIPSIFIINWRFSGESLAIIGGGPSAFYVASRILKLDFKNARVHVFDRLWAPHGLVRYGVAPDHPEVKASSSWF